MKKTKKEKKIANPEEKVILNIPDKDVWDYKIEGLAAPMIGKTYKNYNLKKVLLALAVLVVISLSFLFSVLTLTKDTFEYEVLSDGTYKLVQFSNTGNITELDIDFVSSVKQEKILDDGSVEVVFSKNETKPVTVIREYAFNCDEKVEVINIGAQVKEIDAKSFYSCWALQRIEVDEANPYFCDVDGVLYTKDMKTLICYPINYDWYLAQENGFEKELWPGDEGYDEYKKANMTIVIPSTVEHIGDLALNYNALSDIYLPEGLKTIGNLAFFESTLTENIYSYKGESEQIIGADKVNFTDEDIYLSLPEGLESIGTDAFNYNRALSYMYVPSSVKFIGHHAFWDTVYKEDGSLKGVSYIDVAADESTFTSNVELGTDWLPHYDNGLFPKKIDVNYGATRKAIEK